MAELPPEKHCNNKYIKIELDGWQLLFKEYLLVQTSLHILYPEYVDEQATMETKLNKHACFISLFLNYELFLINNEWFGFRLLWRIIQIANALCAIK